MVDFQSKGGGSTHGTGVQLKDASRLIIQIIRFEDILKNFTYTCCNLNKLNISLRQLETRISTYFKHNRIKILRNTIKRLTVMYVFI